MHGADYYPYAPDPHSFYPHKILAGRYLCISVLAVLLSQFQQPIWAPPANLAMKPVTLGLLLIPCVLGWTMHDLAGGWLVKDIETGRWTLHDAASLTSGAGWWKHRDRHFACAAIAYNVWLASRGPDGVLTMRSFESGYGAAKILLSIHVLIIAWAMIPAEHWPL